MAATLTPSATTGNGILFTASQAVFLEGDVGRQIIAGAGRGIIVGFGASAGDVTSPNTKVRVDILDAFASTAAIPTGSWFVRLSPQTTLDPDKKGPAGSLVTLTAGAPAFRVADLNKFITIYGGLVRINQVVSNTVVTAIILNPMLVEEDDPLAAPAGAWTLEVSSWSAEKGFPRTGEFFGGRLGQASTAAQPTTWWLSASDNYDNYGAGPRAEDAVEYTMTTRELNRIEWLADHIDLFIGTSGTEHIAKGGKSDEPIGGDVIPKVDKFGNRGSAPVQPIVANGRIIFVDRSAKQIYEIVYDFENNSYDVNELTAVADHITGRTGVFTSVLAYQKKPDSRIFFIRIDTSQAISLTYFPREKVVGFTQLETQGFVVGQACISQSNGRPDQVWNIIGRTINGVVRRYVEFYEEEVDEVFTRPWQSLQTDSAVVYKGAPITFVTGLNHLEGLEIDVVADGGFRGTKIVQNGEIELNEEASEVEVGLHYESIVETMRPALQNVIMEGIPRSWDKIFIRVLDSIGGVVNGERVVYPADPLNTQQLKTGDFPVSATGWDLEGRLRIVQDQPYPMTLLAVFGTVSFGEVD